MNRLGERLSDVLFIIGNRVPVRVITCKSLYDRERSAFELGRDSVLVPAPPPTRPKRANHLRAI